MSAEIINFPRAFRRNDRGGAAIEAAVCMPILALMIMGGFWFGWTQHQISTMRYALQGASRALVLDPDLTEAQLATLVSDELGKQSGNLTFGLAIVNNTNGKEATLSATYATTLQIPIAGAFPVTRSATVTTYLPVI